MRARTELFIPAGDSVSLVSFSFSATLWTRENFPLHLLLLFLHSVSFFLTFLSFHFFHLFFPSTIQPRGNPAPYSSREIFSKTGIVFLIFLANHSPGISLRRNFYLSLSPFFFRFLSSTSQEILPLSRDFGKLRFKYHPFGNIRLKKNRIRCLITQRKRNERSEG